MKKVAIFGNSGGGKSTLAHALAQELGLPLYALDKLQYKPGGEAVPHEDYLNAHQAVLEQNTWVIEGYGCYPSVMQRIEEADTLIHIDLPLWRHWLWVTKRMFKGFFFTPQGWPEKSPMLKSTLNSYRVLWPCHSKLTPVYRRALQKHQQAKKVYSLKSPAQIRGFLAHIKKTP